MLDGVFTIPLPGQFQASEVSLPASISRGGPLGEFIAGPENRLAVAALLALVSEKEVAQPWVDCGGPLVLCGLAGAGKSHLAGGLAHALRQRDPGAVISHLLAAEYARELAHAIDTHAVREWESRYRNSDLLIVEDLDHLAAKPSAQDHLARTIDLLLKRGAKIVVTSSAHPGGMGHLTAALRSRLSGGLVVPLALPGVAARRLILERLASERGISISPEGASLLANGIDGSARDLMGTITYLETSARQRLTASGGSLKNADCPSAISDREIAEYLTIRRAEATPGLATIAGRTAKYFALRLNEIRGPARRRNVALARNVAMYLARQLTGLSFEKIGDYFGGRDHTTALHACRRVAQLAEMDTETQRAIAQLRAELAC